MKLLLKRALARVPVQRQVASSELCAANSKEHPCWATTMHELSHVAVYIELGGIWGNGIEMHLEPDSGFVQVRSIGDCRQGDHRGAYFIAAGIAADRILGVASGTGHGSDWYQLRRYARFHGYSNDVIEQIIHRVQGWLESVSSIIEAAAQQLIAVMYKNGRVAKTRLRRIVTDMVVALHHHQNPMVWRSQVRELVAIFKKALWFARHTRAALVRCLFFRKHDSQRRVQEFFY